MLTGRSAKACGREKACWWIMSCAGMALLCVLVLVRPCFPASTDAEERLMKMDILALRSAEAREKGAFLAALQLLEQLLQKQVVFWGEESDEVAQTYDALGVAWYGWGDYDKALAFHEKSLSLQRRLLAAEEEEETLAMAETYDRLGFVTATLGDVSASLHYYTSALRIKKKHRPANHYEVADSYKRMADVLYLMGNYDRARALLTSALAMEKQNFTLGYWWSPLFARNGLARTLVAQGEYAKARVLYEQSIQHMQKILGKTHPALGPVYYGMAELWYAMGEYTAAKALCEQVLTLHQPEAVEHSFVHAEVYVLLAAILYKTGDYAGAEALFNNVLALTVAAVGEEHHHVVSLYSHLAHVLTAQGQHARARELYARALALALKTLGEEHPETALMYGYMGHALLTAGEEEKALEALARGFVIAMRSSAPWVQQELAFRYSVGLKTRQHRESAIFYAKIGVNTLQSMRVAQEGLDRPLQQSFMKTVQKVYHYLVEVLTEQGRIVEAQQVLRMLKEAELFDFLVRAPAEDVRANRIDYIGPEKAAYQNMQGILNALAGLDAQLLPVDEHKLGAQPSRRDSVGRRVEAEQEKLKILMDNLHTHLASLNPEKGDDVRKAQWDMQGHFRPVMELMKPGTVLLHTVMLPDALWILATSSGSALPEARKTAISYAAMSVNIRDFRQLLVDRNKDPRPLAQALYGALIAPVQAILDREQAHTLLLSLDGPLRYLPPAALHDGSQWLAEKYAVSIFTEAACGRLRQPSAAPWRVAGLGVSKAHGAFPALPAVRQELAAIVKTPQNPGGVLEGEFFLDADFTARRLGGLLQKRYPVVHVATHFSFNPGTVHDSFMLTGDGKRLTLAALKGGGFPFAEVEQLTLSACNTAMSTHATGSEVESFGALAQHKGAQSVLAALWPVDDSATGAFMARYYREKQRGLSRAEALRQAQLACLRGQLDAVSALKQRRGIAVIAAASHVQRPFPGFTHPYFWAPFLLMGNWQ